MMAVANSHDTSKVVNNGAAIEDGQKFPPPSAEEQTQHKIDKDDASAAEGNNTSDKGRLSPIEPSRHMNISNNVTSGPDGVRVETIFHAEGTHPFEGTDTSVTRKPDFGLTNVTGNLNSVYIPRGNNIHSFNAKYIKIKPVFCILCFLMYCVVIRIHTLLTFCFCLGVMDTLDRGDITGLSCPEIDIPPVSSLEEGTLREPLLRPVGEGRKLEILKSIVYGGLIESITSLGVISSAAGSGASMCKYSLALVFHFHFEAQNIFSLL